MGRMGQFSKRRTDKLVKWYVELKVAEAHVRFKLIYSDVSFITLRLQSKR